MKTKHFLLAVAFATMAFTFSCSSGGGEGEDFETVTIGTQIWMAKNLNYNVSGSKCYNNLDSNCEIYGRLYDWITAMALPPGCNSSTCSSQIQAKHKGICPSGWHIPSHEDWGTLRITIGDNAGTKLKAKSRWNEGGNGTDDYGFSALPAGGGLPDGSFLSIGDYGVWWSSSEGYDSDYEAHLWAMNYGVEYFGTDSNDKTELYSVRCLKD